MAKKVKPIKTVYKVYDTDDYAVCKFVYQDDVLLEAWRKQEKNKEFNLLENSPQFAYKCFYEGDEVSEEFYKNYSW